MTPEQRNDLIDAMLTHHTRENKPCSYCLSYFGHIVDRVEKLIDRYAVDAFENGYEMGPLQISLEMAWDRGYHRGVRDGTEDTDQADNPYRSNVIPVRRRPESICPTCHVPGTLDFHWEPTNKFWSCENGHQWYSHTKPKEEATDEEV